MIRPVVLAVGRDPLLLETRSQVLRNAGYIVVSVQSVKDAFDQFRAGDFDLVVLCHSVSPEDRERLTYLIRAHSPATPVVLISAVSFSKDSSADATISNDPHALLAGLKEVLGKSGESISQSRRHESPP